MSTLRGIAAALNVSVDYIFRVATGRFAAVGSDDAALHPDWAEFPVTDVPSSNHARSVAYVSRVHLERIEANPADVAVYRLMGGCMLSAEAERADRPYLPGDLIAIHLFRAPNVGSVTLATWSATNRAAVVRFGVDSGSFVASPIVKSGRRVRIDLEDAEILGPLVWRAG